MTNTKTNCPACKSQNIGIFYKISNVPVHSVILLFNKKEARNYPSGDIELALCKQCGFIFNSTFEGSLQEYSAKYEETQSFSDTFTKFHTRLAEQLIKRYDLHQKHIIEIGCGKGEFLIKLCELGNNTGVGIDPAYVDNRLESSAMDRVIFIKDFYSSKYQDQKADFICCKMTLEHISEVSDFMRTVRTSIENEDTIIFFQIPESGRIFKSAIFWDIYYEHCSYFYEQSLSALFELSGFDVNSTWVDYDAQYMMIEAKIKSEANMVPIPSNNITHIKQNIDKFSSEIQRVLDKWRTDIRTFHSEGKNVVLWGGGSKAVAFLTTLGIQDEIEIVVDINPFKNNTYIAGTGQHIVSPAYLKLYHPDVVIVMNSIYVDEIRAELKNMQLQPQIIGLD